MEKDDDRLFGWDYEIGLPQVIAAFAAVLLIAALWIAVHA